MWLTHGAILIVRRYCWVHRRLLEARGRARMLCRPPTLVIAVVADARCAEVRQSGDNPALGWSSKLLTRHREMGSTLRHAGNAYNIMLR